MEEKELRRAGLDYWKDLDVSVYENFEDFMQRNPSAKLFMATTKAKKNYAEVRYPDSAYLMFGKESAGLPEELQYQECAVRIPMKEEIRSLNLSNSVAIVLYEALRQQDFVHMQREGELHRLSWR